MTTNRRRSKLILRNCEVNGTVCHMNLDVSRQQNEVEVMVPFDTKLQAVVEYRNIGSIESTELTATWIRSSKVSAFDSKGVLTLVLDQSQSQNQSQVSQSQSKKVLDLPVLDQTLIKGAFLTQQCGTK